MNNLLFGAILLASLFTASEASQQTNSKAKSLVVILHLDPLYTPNVEHGLQTLVKCPAVGSLAVYVVMNNDYISIFPASIPGYGFERDNVPGELKGFITNSDLPTNPIFKRQTLIKIKNSYTDSCPRAIVVIVTSGMCEEADWSDFHNTTILVLQLNETIKNSRSSWEKLVPDDVRYMNEGKFPEIKHISKVIFEDSSACTTENSEKFIRLCIPKSKGGARQAGSTPPAESSPIHLWFLRVFAIIEVVLVVSASVVMTICYFTERRKAASDIWLSHPFVNRLIQNQYDDLKNEIPRITLPPAELGVTKGKIVLFGPVGHGKSSFINSVIRIAKEAPDGASEESMTMAYNKFVCGNLLVTETMAIKAWDRHGFNIKDITYLLKGNIKTEYKFDPANPISQQSQDFEPNPSPADRVHCVILCQKATELANIQPEHIEEIQALQDAIDKLNIPRIMILTNVDGLDPLNNKKFDAVDIAGNIFQIQGEFIYPVQCFTREINPNPRQDIWLLKALKKALEFANNQNEAL